MEDVCICWTKTEHEDWLLIRLLESNVTVLGAWNEGDEVFFAVKDLTGLKLDLKSDEKPFKRDSSISLDGVSDKRSVRSRKNRNLKKLVGSIARLFRFDGRTREALIR